MVRVHSLPDWVVHGLQLLHLLINLVVMVLSLDRVDGPLKFFQIEYFALELMKFILMVHIKYWIG